MKLKTKGAAVLAAALGCVFATLTTTATYAASGDTLKTVKDRGHLLCSGHNGSFPPFVEVSDDNKWKGYDIDYCRALNGEPENCTH